MALVSCAILIYEIAVTRLLSVVVWYHFAFLVVSLAMLGLGLPGVWYSLRPPRPGTTAAWRLLVLGGIALPVSIVVIVKGLARLALLQPAEAGSWITPHPLASVAKISLLSLSVLAPFVLLGGAVCLFLLSARGRRVAPMYAANLAGAAAGAAAVVPLLHVMPTPSLLAACGLLPLAAAVLLRAENRRALLALGLALVGGVVWGWPFTLRHNKVYEETGLGLMHERWTPTARLTVFPNVFWAPRPELAFGWGMGTAFPGAEIEQRWIAQDGSAGTPITRYNGAAGALDHLLFDVTSLGYQLRPPQSVCIIGAGGGRDILTAVLSGASAIDAVELNADMIELVNEELRELSGAPYSLPGVRTYAEEGRSFLAQIERRYDLLQISLTDSWAATAAGAYALAENYLYTTEAVRLYRERLTDRGLASVSRWMVGSMEMEAVRLAVLVERTLEGLGVEEPRRHIAVVQGGYVATLLFSRKPFGAEELARLEDIAVRRGFVVHWPVPSGRARDDSVIQRVLTEGITFLGNDGFYLEPPTDERPFFFQNVRAFGRSPSARSGLSHNDTAALLPRYLILAVGLATLALFFTPFLVPGTLATAGDFWRGSLYFVAIGLGFMFVEVPLIQRFVLYLGHPSYAITLVLAGILLGSGLGSLAAGCVPVERLARLRLLAPAAVMTVLTAIHVAVGETLGWSFPSRAMISLVLVLPLGFVLGFPFPLGMMRFSDRNRAWFWALNGAASVLASASAVTLATYVNLTGVGWLGAGCYVTACLALPAEPGTARPFGR